MGFGYLLIGYILAFVMSLSNLYLFTDIIGGIVMLMGLSALSNHGKNFLRAMWADMAYMVISAARVILMMLKMLEEGSVLSYVFGVLIPVAALILQFFIFAGIHYLAAEVELPNESVKARNCIRRLLSYYILYIIAYILVPYLDNMLGNIIGLAVTVYGLVVIVLCIVLIHSCYCRICLKGQEHGERTQSKHEWLNKWNEKTDKMFDGAFLRVKKESRAQKEESKEEPEPGYLRVKRKKQGKHKK